MTRTYNPNGTVETAFDRAMQFFRDNPDEVLLRPDIQVKFGCCYRTAKSVARQLIQAGVPRAQLPRNPRRPDKKPVDVAPTPQEESFS